MNQNSQILEHLKHKPITCLEAANQYGIMRLSARIYDLKQAGHTIAGKQKKVKNRYGNTCHVSEYKLLKNI